MRAFSCAIFIAVFLLCSTIVVLIAIEPVYSSEYHGMTVDDNGMVINENKDNIPTGCNDKVIDEELSIVADSHSQHKTKGTTFSFYPRVFNVKPCTRITVTFKNNDKVRHQWRVPGLPRFMYNGGMFHMEANGGKISGVPGETGYFFAENDGLFSILLLVLLFTGCLFFFLFISKILFDS